jgi:hypothetical protein
MGTAGRMNLPAIQASNPIMMPDNTPIKGIMMAIISRGKLGRGMDCIMADSRAWWGDVLRKNGMLGAGYPDAVHNADQQSVHKLTAGTEARDAGRAYNSQTLKP